MTNDKKRRIAMLYEIERLTDKETLTRNELSLINRYRKELRIEKQTNEPKFSLDKYLKLVRENPRATDAERAKLMDISKNQLCCGKRRHKLIGLGVEKLLELGR